MKKKVSYRVLSLITGLFIGLTAFSASADIITMSPFGDGYIRAGQTPNNVTGNIFLVGNTTINNDELRGFMQFDLSDPSLVGFPVQGVSLRLTIDDPDLSGGGSVDKLSTLNLWLITESFTESGATWTSRDGTNNWSTPGGTFESPPIAFATVNAATVVSGDEITFSGSAFDDAVSNAIGGNLGLLLTLDSPNYSERTIFRFVSRTPEPFQEWKSDWTPELTVIPEPSTFAMLAIAGVAAIGLLRRRN